mgnify:FL=1
MKKYKINFGNGTAWLNTEIVEVEDYECEQDAVDKMIDKLENEGSEGCFLDPSEITENGGTYPDDEYIIGGNHDRILYHGGNFLIEKV